MAQVDTNLSTGLPGLDNVFRGLIPGDNIVWQVGSIEEYAPFVEPYCKEAARRDHRLIYFRFARHEQLIPDGVEAEVHEVHPDVGFETFLAEVHAVIEEVGHGGFYVFDCLSELTADWYIDRNGKRADARK